MSKAKMMVEPPEDERFKKTFFLVEATSFERQCLWEEWNDRVRWVDETNGYFGQIGVLAGRPVMIVVFWARIEGKLVGFWQMTSQVRDSALAEEWFAKNCTPAKWDNGTRPASTNASNFHLCSHAIEEASKRRLVATSS